MNVLPRSNALYGGLSFHLGGVDEHWGFFDACGSLLVSVAGIARLRLPGEGRLKQK